MHEFHKHLTDKELLEKYYSDKNPEWIGTLLQRYTILLFGVGMKYLGDEDEAKDLVQQVFLKVLTELPKYKVDYFKSWIYMVAKNQCLMQLRSKGLKPFHLNETINSVSNDENDISEIFERERLLNALENAITNLSKEQATCIRAFYLEKKSYQVIAYETGMDLMKVKSNIQNGRRNIKIILEKNKAIDRESI